MGKTGLLPYHPCVRVFISVPHSIITTSPKSAVARCSQSIMPETCIKFGEHGARIMIEEKEVPHFAIDVNSEKKEVSCWIASEEGKVRESFCY